MKRIAAFLTGALLLVSASAAIATPIPSGDFVWSNAPYWTNTDHTTNSTGNSGFTKLTFTSTAPLSFGLFDVVDLNATVKSVDTRFEIFAANAPFFSQKTVTFREQAGVTQVTLGNPNLLSTVWTNFSKAFGFYFGDTANPTNYYYSDESLNTTQAGTPFVFTTVDSGQALVNIYYSATGQPSDDANVGAYVQGNDLSAVPEPGTIALLGLGIIALPFIRRQAKK